MPWATGRRCAGIASTGSSRSITTSANAPCEGRPSGRKNWLFAGSDRGGHAAAVFYTLIACAQRHNLDPLAYLRGVLARIASTPISQIEPFLPDRWANELQLHTQMDLPALPQ